MNHLFSLLSFSLLIFTPFMIGAQNIEGAWKIKGSDNHLLLVQDGYFAWTETNDENEFINTLGGRVNAGNGNLNVKIEFNADDRYMVGDSYTVPFKLENNKLEIRHPEGYTMEWERIPENDQGLAGLWRITGRESDGKMNEIGRSPRVTYKLLTPGHFQWMAINTSTGEFFGTGGGTYTFENGKYTENIGFFSRDNSRVGASLSFDGELKDGHWHHSGKSSVGNPIYEIWSRENLD